MVTRDRAHRHSSPMVGKSGGMKAFRVQHPSLDTESAFGDASVA
jgi:hypothetical protein